MTYLFTYLEMGSAVSELLRRKHGTLKRYISVHQPSAEISSGLDSKPFVQVRLLFTSDNYWGVNLLTLT